MAGISRLSTHEIMRVSRDTFNKLCSQRGIDLSTIQKFFDSAHFGLSDDEVKDVELAVLLIASAHKVNDKHFNYARKLLNLCDFLSSCRGNSVQRVVHYFTKALQERIARETGIIPLEETETEERTTLHSFQPASGVNPGIVSTLLRVPCIQIAQFAGIQAVIDSLASAKRLHLIDLAIRNGEHCSVLMQALANQQENPAELLKITAVGISESEQKIAEVGKWLTLFAETLHLPFQFNTAIIVHIKDLKEEIFETNDDEVVAVISQVGLRRMRAFPDYLETHLSVLRTLNPCVLVIVEAEANHSSSVFIDRFLESLVSYSACYDCIEDCIKTEIGNRLVLEAFLGQEIRDIVAAKDEGRIYSHMKIDEWRDYLNEFGMVETEVGISSFDQAMLLVKNFACGESCLIARNGKCLVVGWKGTPLLSVSAWKFQQGLPKTG